MALPKKLSKKLKERRDSNSFRQLSSAEGLIDFASNDYLGFAREPKIFKAAGQIITDYGLGNGSTGSRLISGNHNLFAQAEELIAGYHSAEDSLIFNSGYDANLGFFSSVPQKGDTIIYDAHCHASIRDGIRLGLAKSTKYRHNDLNHLRELLERLSSKSRTEDGVYVVTESIFSMDGDSPNINSLASICHQYNAKLILDEAHSTGIGKVFDWNEEFLNEVTFTRIVTFGKALGTHGAAILGSRELKDYLINFCRSFIYTTALDPMSVAKIMASYNLLALPGGINAQRKLQSNIEFFNQGIKARNVASGPFLNSPIQKIIVAGNIQAKGLANKCRELGYDVRAILSPTVATGSERLRISLHAHNTESQIIGLLDTIYGS